MRMVVMQITIPITLYIVRLRNLFYKTGIILLNAKRILVLLGFVAVMIISIYTLMRHNTYMCVHLYVYTEVVGLQRFLLLSPMLSSITNTLILYIELYFVKHIYSNT